MRMRFAARSVTIKHNFEEFCCFLVCNSRRLEVNLPVISHTESNSKLALEMMKSVYSWFIVVRTHQQCICIVPVHLSITGSRIPSTCSTRQCNRMTDMCSIMWWSLPKPLTWWLNSLTQNRSSLGFRPRWSTVYGHYWCSLKGMTKVYSDSVVS